MDICRNNNRVEDPKSEKCVREEDILRGAVCSAECSREKGLSLDLHRLKKEEKNSCLFFVYPHFSSSSAVNMCVIR